MNLIHVGTSFVKKFADAIKSGIMMRNLHVDIIEAHNYGISSVASGFLEETVQDGMVSKDIAISTELKRELEEADWGTVLTLYVFAAMIAMNQCFRGGQLLRASLKVIINPFKVNPLILNQNHKKYFP